MYCNLIWKVHIHTTWHARWRSFDWGFRPKRKEINTNKCLGFQIIVKSWISKGLNPYVRRYRHLSASLFGDIFWMTTKCANLINFEHPRGAKWLEKCIVFDKKCLPSEKGLLHRRNHCGILPYQNSYHEMHKRPNFEALWTSVRRKTKIQDNFSLNNILFVMYTQKYNCICEFVGTGNNF